MHGHAIPPQHDSAESLESCRNVATSDKTTNACQAFAHLDFLELGWWRTAAGYSTRGKTPATIAELYSPSCGGRLITSFRPGVPFSFSVPGCRSADISKGQVDVRLKIIPVRHVAAARRPEGDAPGILPCTPVFMPSSSSSSTPTAGSIPPQRQPYHPSR